MTRPLTCAELESAVRSAEHNLARATLEVAYLLPWRAVHDYSDLIDLCRRLRELDAELDEARRQSTERGE